MDNNNPNGKYHCEGRCVKPEDCPCPLACELPERNKVGEFMRDVVYAIAICACLFFIGWVLQQ